MSDDKEVFAIPVGRIIEPEWFAPTMHLRLAVYEENTALPPILQQAWQGSRGTLRWRAVPVVGVPLAEFEAAAAETP